MKKLMQKMMGLMLLAMAVAGLGANLASAQWNNLPGIEGGYCQIKDGPVKCVVYDSYKSGGIDCYKTTTAKVSVPDTDSTFNVKGCDGYVLRKKVDGRACYFYDGYRAAGVSCLSQ